MDPAVQAYIKSPTQPKQYFDAVNRALSTVGHVPLQFHPVKMPTEAQSQKSMADAGALPVNWSGDSKTPSKPFGQGTMYMAERTGDIRKDIPGAAKSYMQANDARRAAWERLGISLPDEIYQGYVNQGRMLPIAPPYKTADTGKYFSWYMNQPAHTKIYATTDPSARAHSNSRYALLGVDNINPSGSVVEEAFRHVQDVPYFGNSFMPGALGRDAGSGAWRKSAIKYGQSWNSRMPYYNAGRWVSPQGSAMNVDLNNGGLVNNTLAMYSFSPAEMTKTLGFLQNTLSNKYGKKFPDYNSAYKWMRENGMFTGGRFNEQKFEGSDIAGDTYSRLYSDLFGQDRDLMENKMLTQAAYRRNPTDPIAKRNYERSLGQYNAYRQYLNHVWPQLLPTEATGPAVQYYKQGNN